MDFFTIASIIGSVILGIIVIAGIFALVPREFWPKFK